MVMTPPPGLREHLAARAARADQLTSTHRVLENVDRRLHGQPRRHGRLLVVVVAALVAASLSGALVLPRVVHRTPSAPAQPDAPRTGAPLLWLGTGVTTDRVAYDWSGHRAGTLHFDPPLYEVLPSPDGRTLLVIPGQGSPYLIDAAGHLLGSYTERMRPPHWQQLTQRRIGYSPETFVGTDDRTLCVAGGASFDRPMLYVLRPDGSERAVVPLGPGDVIQPTWHLRACDAAADRAVLVDYGTRSGERVSWRVIQLSTGRELLRHWAGSGPVGMIAVDGRWLAEGASNSTTRVVYDLRDDSVVGRVNGYVYGIFAGGRRVLSRDVSKDDLGGFHTLFSVVDVASGQVLWQRHFDGIPLISDMLATQPRAVISSTDNIPGSGCHEYYTLIDASGPTVSSHTVHACV